MQAVFHDLRYGIRTLLKTPGFTLVAVLALALGIGANTAIFTVVNAILIRPLPYPNPDRLVVLWENNTREGWSRTGVSGATYMDWKEQATLFEDMSLHEPGSGTLTGAGEPQQVPGMRVTTNFFELLGAKAQYGRLFTAREAANRQNVFVMTDGCWRRRMGADPNIVGKVFQVDGLPYTLVGVLSPDFWLPIPSEAFVPWWTDALRGMPRSARNFGVLGRMKPGVTIEQAREQMNAVARRIAERNTDMREWSYTMMPLKETLVAGIRPALLVLLGAVGFVLLIACSNLANLLLARAAGREKEVAIRVAIGASRGRLIRQFLTESLTLGIAGGALGLLFALWGVNMLSNILPQSVSVEGSSTPLALAGLTIDWRVLAFTVVASLATGVLFGLAPALAASGTKANEAMKDGGRTSAGSRHNRLRSVLVVSEIALALVLLTGAGLLMRSFWRMQQVNPGFRPDHVLTAEVELPTDSKYRKPEERRQVFQRFLRAVQGLPGVRTAALTQIVPMTDYEDMTSFEIEGGAAVPGRRMEADYRTISPAYFQVLNIPLLRGRYFDDHDGDGHNPPCVVIVDQALVRPYFPNENPVNHRLRFRSFNASCEIVGVVGEVKHAGLNRQARPTVYFPYLLANEARMSFVIRTASDPLNLARAVKQAVWSVDRDQPVYNIRTMDELISSSTSAPRFTLSLLGVFASAALFLAAIGIYGVLSYAVSRRAHEIGIRMALGASGSDVLRQVLKEASRLAAFGIGTGVVAALALTRVLSSLLYGVSAVDAPTFAAVALVLGVVALAAGYIPARRATKVAPIVSLRYE